jgi:hypothetical protein
VNPQLLADPTAAPESEPSTSVTVPEDSANGTGPTDPGASAAPEAATSAPEPVRTCANCGAALDDGQDWCLQCGAAVPGSLDGGGPGWRSATTVLAVTAVLVLGAAAAAYAALTQPAPRKLAPKVITIAQAPPTTPASTPTTPPAPGALGTPTTIKPLPSSTPAPKIPLTASTPKSSESTGSVPGTTNSGTGEAGTGTTKSTTKSSGGTTPAEQPSPILLDTNAASTYNPYGYPTSWFGDPSLAIDGETSTAWTAQVNPTVAPKMAEGIAVDLKTAQKVGSVKLITSTPGMTVQMYGANGTTLPASITDPAWVALSPSLDAKKRTTKIKLRDASKAFRFVTLWISSAPQSAVGTPTAPGHISVNELELFA